MRQAIEERFILDVLKNYTTYKTYWKLLEEGREDPRYDQDKASYLLGPSSTCTSTPSATRSRSWSSTSASNVGRRIGGKAKAMIVTRSRLHAVRYKLILDAYLKEKGLPVQGAGGVLRYRPGRRHRLHRGRDERLARGADRRDVPAAGVPLPHRRRRSSRPGSTSRCCTRCTSTRSSPGCTPSRRSPG